ncbi:PD-(D/E)XK nuclease family protein [Candidatus Parcubacteria bacterium]|nr:PD-(D/E)XK nuclease family protein [Candidatus Parcubacteria bacterium]
MSQYYKPNRNPGWNYGGPNWKLSRSKISLFLDCPRCFYIDNKLGVARPPGFPFNLNSAVDHLLKKEFDVHRDGGTAHPLMEAYGIKAIPFKHKDIDIWRENFKGVQHLHSKTNFLISGAVDDIWINDKEELHIVDYKATSKDTEVNLDADWQDGYRRQIDIYQWLLRQKGFKVSNTGYFVYANGLRDKKAFDGKLEFNVKIIPYEGNDDWVEKTLDKIKECLDDSRIPACTKTCDYCNYVTALGDVLRENVKASIDVKKTLAEAKPKKTRKTKVEEIDAQTLPFL